MRLKKLTGSQIIFSYIMMIYLHKNLKHVLIHEIHVCDNTYYAHSLYLSVTTADQN